MLAHTCRVDCELVTGPTGLPAHVMRAAEPSSAAGRYQWELNRDLLNRGRRAWRESGQGQSRACRVWDEMRRESTTWALGYSPLYGIRRAHRLELALLTGN